MENSGQAITVTLPGDGEVCGVVGSSAHHRPSRGYELLLGTLLLLFFLYPISDQSGYSEGLLDFLSSSTIVVAVCTLNGTSAQRKGAGIVAAAALLFTWMDHVVGGAPFDGLQHLSTVVLKTYAAYQIVRDVLRHHRPSLNDVCGIVSAYFLLGFIWTSAFVGLEDTFPGAFVDSKGAGAPLGFSRLMYYSFTNLTTLGYGDIVATLPLAQSLAVLEGITGQLYLGILVAYVVGSLPQRRSA